MAELAGTKKGALTSWEEQVMFFIVSCSATCCAAARVKFDDWPGDVLSALPSQLSALRFHPSVGISKGLSDVEHSVREVLTMLVTGKWRGTRPIHLYLFYISFMQF